MIEFEIGGCPVLISTVWVHLQELKRGQPYPFKLIIPNELTSLVIDPYREKCENTSWANFIEEDVRDLGTFAVESYIDNIRSLMNISRKPFEWVIATVENIEENGTNLVISGQSLKFMPSNYSK